MCELLATPLQQNKQTNKQTCNNNDNLHMEIPQTRKTYFITSGHQERNNVVIAVPVGQFNCRFTTLNKTTGKKNNQNKDDTVPTLKFTIFYLHTYVTYRRN